MIRLLASAAAAALLTGCMSDGDAASAGPGARMMMAADPAARSMPTDAMGYVKMAGASDMFEIESSRAALQSAQSADVRAFAQMMIDHHTKTSADLMAAAHRGGVHPPAPMLPPDKAAKVQALRGARGADFDRMYMREQVRGHEEALMLHRAYADRGDNAELKGAAAKTVPIVQGHLQQAVNLAGRVGG